MYLGLSKRLITSLIVIETIVMAIVIWSGAQLLENSVAQQHEQALENERMALLSSLSDGLAQLDQRSLQQQLSYWQVRDDIIYIVLFNHKMNVMASIGGIAEAEIPEQSKSTFADAIIDGSYHLSLPVELEGERIGTLKLGYRTDHIQHAITQAQRRNMLVPLLLFIIIVVITAVLGRRMTANLRRIESGVQAFQQGNFDHHIQSSQDGLFGNIAEVLNHFARDLQNKIGDLNVGNERLQESVEALQLEIAAKNQTEAELRVLQQRMLLQREQSPLAIIDWSADFRVVDWNPAAEKIFGYSKDEALGKRAIELIVPAEVDKAIFNDNWQKLLEQSGGEQSINNNITKDGRAIICEWYNTRIIDEGGEVVGVFSRIVDITEKRNQQQMLQRSQKMDALGKLTGGIAHDYNNMLGVVLGYATMLKRVLKDQPKLVSYVEQIQHAGERGATLSKKLLAFSRNMSSEPQEINLNSVLKSEQMMLEKSLTARIKLTLELESESWSIWVDQSDLVDAILNMSINAMHAMPDGGELTIHTQNFKLDPGNAESMGVEPGEYMLLSLTDTGLGIDQETQAHIFEPFFTTKGEGGSGLGLSQVYGFVQRANGAIKLYSDVGRGARFSLYFPRYLPEETDEAMVEDSGAQEEPLISEVVEIRGGEETILVVDDEEGLRMVTEEFLSSVGYQVITAESGKAALEAIKGRHVDLLLSDIVMPEMDGYQLAKKVKELYPDIKIQLASGYNDERHQSFATTDLRKRMLHKPFELKKLLARVRELLDSDEVVEVTSALPNIEWSEQTMTGIGEIDDDHRILFELLNRCRRLVSSMGPPADMSSILNELQDYTIYHFRREELIMEACEYPHLKNHRRIHNMLLKRTIELVSEYDRGELKPTKLLDFLSDWLLDHIMTMDKAIAPYCEGRDAEIKEALER